MAPDYCHEMAKCLKAVDVFPCHGMVGRAIFPRYLGSFLKRDILRLGLWLMSHFELIFRIFGWFQFSSWQNGYSIIFLDHRWSFSSLNSHHLGAVLSVIKGHC